MTAPSGHVTLAWGLHQADRAAEDLRRPGSHRDRERTAVGSCGLGVDESAELGWPRQRAWEALGTHGRSPDSDGPDRSGVAQNWNTKSPFGIGRDDEPSAASSRAAWPCEGGVRREGGRRAGGRREVRQRRWARAADRRTRRIDVIPKKDHQSGATIHFGSSSIASMSWMQHHVDWTSISGGRN